MKRQRSFGDGLDDDRRRFYDRGPPPPPPLRRPPREYDGGDRFDRRKGFGGSGFHDGRYREYPSPREYGGDRVMHRSESFSGFRREFPKGFRSERDRSRRDGDGSSAWRRPGSGWRDAECFAEFRAPARPGAASLPAQPQRSRSRSPSEPRRRFEVAKGEKSKKQTANVSEIEEGEVAPDAETKARHSPMEHRKVEPSRAKEKGPDRGKAQKLDSEAPEDLGTQGKGATGVADPDNAGKEEGRKIDGTEEARKPVDKGRGRSSLKVEKEINGGHEAQRQNAVTSDTSKVGLSTSPIQQEMLQEEVKLQERTTNSADVVGQSTSSSMSKEVFKEEATTQQEEATVLHKTGSTAADVGKSTSPITWQEVLQEAVALDSTAYVVHEARESGSSSIPQEVLEDNVMQRDGAASAIDRTETASSDLPLEATQETVTMLDETADNINNLVPVSHSGMLKEAMHEGELQMDGATNTTGVAGQSNSCDMTEEAMHEKAGAQEGICNAVNSTDESNTPTTGLHREAMASPHLQASDSKEFENLTLIGELDKPTEHVAIQPAEEVLLERDHCKKGGASGETMIREKEAAVLHVNVETQLKGIDIEAKADGAHMFLRSTKEHASGNLMTMESMPEDKGNDIAFDVLSKVDISSSVERGLDSTMQLSIEPAGTSKSVSTTSVKQESDTMTLGKLDLSLSLSGCLQNSESKGSIQKTASLVHAVDSQPLPSSFRSKSDGFPASMSLTNSQPLGHNPSCSFTQQSLDNYEHSVGSKPFFMGIDQMSNNTGRQAQLSGESTQKGSATPFLQRVLQNGHTPDANSLAGIKGHNSGISNDFRRHANIPGVLSPTHSRGSHDSGFERNRQKRQLTRERSSSSLTRGELQEGEQLVINGAGVIERIIFKVVSDPLHLTGRMLQEMTENSITYLREAISEIIVDPGKRGQIITLQEALQKRSDLNSDMLRTCPRVLMEILVAIKTGLPYFIKKSSSVATSNLVDIFLNLKCRNLSCQSILPVDDCDCKVCWRKTGFCSSCMCIVCSKFDSASNTCSWVGCDVCLHWCHTDCGLRHSLIRKGQSASRAYGTTETQFHCAACGHPSEMFGFVKEVFRTCVRQWKMETLIRELQHVERIFSGSDDVRGKTVRDFVKQMLIKSENRAYHPEVVKCVIAFFSDDDANLGINPSVPLKGIPCSISEAMDGIPSSRQKAAWAPFTLEGLPVLDKTPLLSTTGSPSVPRKCGEAEFRTIDNKPGIDELDSLIRLKQAEAHMYQERANDAHNEVDNLRRIVLVKQTRIEEDYATQIADLDINELQERRKRKIEELQVIERTHHEFLSMKTRMVASIRELLSKMDALKQNRST